jgi:Mg2+ and Co2+ transporter CorA
MPEKQKQDLGFKVFKLGRSNYSAWEEYAGNDPKEFIEYLAIDLNQTLNTSKGALKNISNMRDYYTATLTNRLNKTITLLTFFTVFLTIPTIVFSMYGMNISLPSQYDDHILEIIFGGIILSWGILYIFLKKLRML